MAPQKVCVVTGGNKGIGFAIVEDLCKKFDGVVYLTSRDETRGANAVEKMKKLGFSPSYHQLDIDDIESVNRFADYIKTTYGGLDVLVNNAGIARSGDTSRERPHARVVNVSSAAGHLSIVPGKEIQMKFSDPNLTEKQLDGLMNKYISFIAGECIETGWPTGAYVMSKVGLCALTRIQQNILDCDPRLDLAINSCHPGFIDTDMTAAMTIENEKKGSIEEGAVCPVYLALLPSPCPHKGKYFWKDTVEVDWVNGSPAAV